jgi:hypothetical protein
MNVTKCTAVQSVYLCIYVYSPRQLLSLLSLSESSPSNHDPVSSHLCLITRIAKQESGLAAQSVPGMAERRQLDTAASSTAKVPAPGGETISKALMVGFLCTVVLQASTSDDGPECGASPDR